MSHSVVCKRGLAILAVPLLLASCGGPNNPKPQNQKRTIPVRGEVSIDGKPGYGVKVTLHPKAGRDVTGGNLVSGEAGQDGEFEIRTYGTNDGAPPGDYTLTFEAYDRSGGGPSLNQEQLDLFDGKYADPESSEHSVTVPEDATEVVIPPIDLPAQ